MDAPTPGPTPAANSASARPASAPAASPTGAREKGLVSVVWCRQVDNEAESPGYTTVPTEFPGRKETLDTVRIVGNLAINAADTHDYWDPDPTSKLAYYHNLFLYPANGGQYLCLGRMFLSTEDRPRLGMKTLVLDTATLLESENLGATLRRWYSSMGNPGRGSPFEGRADPAMMEVLADGFLFEHADPARPLVVLVSDNFHDAVESLLTLLERVPSSVALLSGCLVFPYFLPIGRVQLEEFSERFPLSLALTRIRRNEAGGERHQRRVAAWAAQPVHLLDLTQGIPPEFRDRPSSGAPVTWWCQAEPPEANKEMRQGIDLLELPRLHSEETTAELQGGAGRRHELARLASAMGPLARVLEQPSEERAKMDPSVLALADPYLQALEERAREAAGAFVAASLAGVSITPPLGSPPRSSSQEAEPPWRKAPRLRPERTEVVPVPREAPGGAGPPGGERDGAGPSAGPLAAPEPARHAPPPEPGALPPSDAASTLPPALLEDLRSYIDTRIGETRTRVGDLDPDVVGGLERDLERRLEARAKLLISPEALEARIVEVLARRPPPPPPDPRTLLTDEMKAALAEVVSALIAQRLAAEAPSRATKPSAGEIDRGKLGDRMVDLLNGEGGDQRVAMLVEKRIQRYVSASVEADRKATDDRLDLILKELQQRAKAQSELEVAIRSEVRFLDEKLQTLMGRMIPLLKRTWLKIDELEKRPSSGGGASEQKMKRLRDELWREMKRLELDLSERTRMILDRVEGNIQNQGKLWLTLVAQLSTLTEQRRELERIVHESKEDFEPPVGAADDSTPSETEAVRLDDDEEDPTAVEPEKSSVNLSRAAVAPTGEDRGRSGAERQKRPA